MKRIVNISCKLILCAATAIALPAQTFTTIHSFDGTDGKNPYAGLIQADNGDGYGTTENGGTSTTCDGGCGTVFKITPGGTLKTLYSFCVQSGCPDGQYPYAGLFQDANGDFYGTTSAGGASGFGTVFKITPTALTTLHSFGGTDGENPWAGLIQGTDGNFYGTTVNGGADNGQGTVFKMTPGGTLTTLHTFCEQAEGTSCVDGQHPEAGLVQAANGDFYGTTSAGGALAAGGHGTIFKITTSGALTTLYRFCAQSGCSDGSGPQAGLVQGTDGNFYGTTSAGGASEHGEVFKVTPGGALTTLYSFCSQVACSDGSVPEAGLVQATDGNFYGTTSTGGTNRAGTVFEIAPSGTLTTLHSFVSPNAGHQAGLVQATNGDFYGTTWGGGADQYGTVFNLSVGLSPFVKPLPPSGKVGAAVRILGSNLTGATSVTFNGAAAVFTEVSNSEITTTVPAGATSGEVQVVTPSGTLSSNVPFRVLP
jgi:uncharacterized repeat protein (TIGR03803 family)